MITFGKHARRMRGRSTPRHAHAEALPKSCRGPVVLAILCIKDLLGRTRAHPPSLLFQNGGRFKAELCECALRCPAAPRLLRPVWECAAEVGGGRKTAVRRQSSDATPRRGLKYSDRIRTKFRVSATFSRVSPGLRAVPRAGGSRRCSLSAGLLAACAAAPPLPSGVLDGQDVRAAAPLSAKSGRVPKEVSGRQ